MFYVQAGPLFFVSAVGIIASQEQIICMYKHTWLIKLIPILILVWEMYPSHYSHGSEEKYHLVPLFMSMHVESRMFDFR